MINGISGYGIIKGITKWMGWWMESPNSSRIRLCLQVESTFQDIPLCYSSDVGGHREINGWKESISWEAITVDSLGFSQNSTQNPHLLPKKNIWSPWATRSLRVWPLGRLKNYVPWTRCWSPGHISTEVVQQRGTTNTHCWIVAVPIKAHPVSGQKQFAMSCIIFQILHLHLLCWQESRYWYIYPPSLTHNPSTAAFKIPFQGPNFMGPLSHPKSLNRRLQATKINFLRHWLPIDLKTCLTVYCKEIRPVGKHIWHQSILSRSYIQFCSYTSLKHIANTRKIQHGTCKMGITMKKVLLEMAICKNLIIEFQGCTSLRSGVDILSPKLGAFSQLWRSLKACSNFCWPTWSPGLVVS